MEFGNPIVGNEDLIREAIKSPNFSNDPEDGVSGWRIAKDGSATFYNLVVGSDNYFIDENGNAVFASVSADQISLNGTPLTDMFDALPRGIVALTQITGSSAGYTGAAQILAGRIVIPNFDGTRQYVIGGSRLHFNSGTATTIDRMNLDIRINWNAAATTSSTALWAHQERVTNTSAFDQDINFRHPFKSTPPNGNGVDDLHIAVFFASEDTSGQLSMDGVTGSRLYVEDVGPAIDYGTFSLGTGTTPVQTYTKTYSANGSASFQSDGDNRGVSSCYQGYYSSTNGNQFSLISFPYATIQADLAGATITKTELYLNNNHFYSNSGGTAIIGTHNQTSVSGNHPSSQVNDNLDTETFTYGQAKWFTVTNTIGNAFKNNTAKGIALGPAPSNSQSYYGYFAGNGESGEPQLRITYQK
jgi:hypothetical protein